MSQWRIVAGEPSISARLTLTGAAAARSASRMRWRAARPTSRHILLAEGMRAPGPSRSSAVFVTLMVASLAACSGYPTLSAGEEAPASTIEREAFRKSLNGVDEIAESVSSRSLTQWFAERCPDTSLGATIACSRQLGITCIEEGAARHATCVYDGSWSHRYAGRWIREPIEVGGSHSIRAELAHGRRAQLTYRIDQGGR